MIEYIESHNRSHVAQDDYLTFRNSHHHTLMFLEKKKYRYQSLLEVQDSKAEDEH